MRAGQLETLIVIEYKELSQDPVYGTEIVTWQPLVALLGSPRIAAPLWANWVDVLPSRSESVQQGLEMARNQSRVRIRYRSDVTSAMRITRKGPIDVVYQIVGGPAMIGRNEWTELVVEKYSS